jgi:hypothetical protein
MRTRRTLTRALQNREQSANVVDCQDHEKPENCDAATVVPAIKRREIVGRPKGECREMWKMKRWRNMYRI